MEYKEYIVFKAERLLEVANTKTKIHHQSANDFLNQGCRWLGELGMLKLCDLLHCLINTKSEVITSRNMRPRMLDWHNRTPRLAPKRH